MNRSTMRTLLGKRLQDTGSDQFDESALNTLLQVGLDLLTIRILAANRHAFVATATFNQVASQRNYAKPSDLLFAQELGIYDTGAAGNYRVLDKVPFSHARSRPAGDATVWAEDGKFFYISPTPASAVTAGFQLVYVYQPTMSADSDVPPVAPILHSVIVDFATIEGLAESNERATAIERRLGPKLESISTLYGSSVIPSKVAMGGSFRTT